MTSRLCLRFTISMRPGGRAKVHRSILQHRPQQQTIEEGPWPECPPRTYAKLPCGLPNSTPQRQLGTCFGNLCTRSSVRLYILLLRSMHKDRGPMHRRFPGDAPGPLAPPCISAPPTSRSRSQVSADSSAPHSASRPQCLEMPLCSCTGMRTA